MTEEEIKRQAEMFINEHLIIWACDDEDAIKHAIISVQSSKDIITKLYLICESNEAKDKIALANLELSMVINELNSRL